MWTPVAPQDLQDLEDLGNGSDAFVLIGMTALHLSHVHVVDGTVRARVVRAWLLPPIGASAIAADPGATPEEIARRAGWQALRIVSGPIKVPASEIRSARAMVQVEDELSPGDDRDKQPSP
jgi:hypothetical protein